jgi:hypothetical protein
MRNSITLIVALLLSTAAWGQAPAQPAQATAQAQPAQIDLLSSARAELAKAKAELAKATTLSEKVAIGHNISKLEGVISLLEGEKEEKEEKASAPAVLANVGDTFGEEGYDARFSTAAAAAYAAAKKETNAAVKAAKVEAVGDVADALTKRELGQDELHIAAYRAAIESHSASAEAIKAIQQERLIDEKTVESLENPGFFGRIWWWWNRD